jgi:hypothetical protein
MFSFDCMIKEEDPFGPLVQDCALFNHCITSFYDQDSQ